MPADAFENALPSAADDAWDRLADQLKHDH